MYHEKKKKKLMAIRYVQYEKNANLIIIKIIILIVDCEVKKWMIISFENI